jgi:histidinol-phosphate aminotransferase
VKQEVREALVKERQRLFGFLQSIPFLEPYPSSANFILCKVCSMASISTGQVH